VRLRLHSIHRLACPKCLGKSPLFRCILRCKDGKFLVGIDRNQDWRADAGVDLLLGVPDSDVVEEGSEGEVAELEQVGHALLEVKRSNLPRH